MVRSPILYLINVWILIKLLILKLKNLNSPFLNIKDNKKLYKNYFKKDLSSYLNIICYTKI